MSSMPPPLPPRSSQPPRPGATSFAQQSPKFFEGDLVKATPLFLIIAVVIALVSLVMAIIPTSNIHVAILGYLLTPFAVMVLMGWDTVYQRKKTSEEAWFVPNSNYSRILRILAGISLLLSYPHINVIARNVSAKLAENSWFIANMSWLF